MDWKMKLGAAVLGAMLTPLIAAAQHQATWGNILTPLTILLSLAAGIAVVAGWRTDTPESQNHAAIVAELKPETLRAAQAAVDSKVASGVDSK